MDLSNVFNEFGWETFYFAGLITGCIFGVIACCIVNIADAITEYIKQKKKND